MMKEIVFSSWEGKVVDNRGKDPDFFDTVNQIEFPEYFKADEKIRALIGWYGIVLRDDTVNVVDLCRSYMEAVHQHSCGKCTPCRRGTGIISELLTQICNGHGKIEDLAKLKTLAEMVSVSSKCDIGQSGPLPLIDALDHFKDDFIQAISEDKPLKAGLYRSMKTAPCIDACPIHLDIPTYVERIKEGKFLESLDVIRERLPLPGILGRVCVRPCEEHCRRANLDKPISIKYLKRFVSDHELALKKNPAYHITPSKKTGRVAIIGAGPAGITCAYHLARRGHQVTVYERLGEPGGMSAMGIPDYRLPRPILRREVEQVQQMGVEIKYNTYIGKDVKLADLVNDSDAVFIGVGAQGSSSMRVKGEDEGYKGFIPGVQYLLDINEGRDPYPEGKRVVVIGGGNVAIDCVRCSFRIGKEDVNLVYRRTRNEMPADEVEIVDAEEEEVQFHFLTTPVRIIEKNGIVTGLECIRMELGEPDKSGRRRPVPIEGSEFVFDCDTVVPAIGQRTDMSLLDGVDGIDTTPWGTIVVDEVTKQSTHEKIFSAGDCETGPGALITACAGGKRAAESIDSLINGNPLTPNQDEHFDMLFKKVPVYDADEEMPMVGGQDRKELDMLSPETRKYTFDEVEKGYPNSDAIAEARRCLRCYRVATVAV